MGVEIHLIGRPALQIDGSRAAGPRGRKAWGLLAFLLLNRRPVSRQQLAELLFADASDPLAALRWNLSELRRALSRRDAFHGDPIVADLGPHTTVDVERVTTALPEALPGMDIPAGELLEGLAWPASPAFETWVLAERRCVAMALESVLRERTLLALAACRPDDASRSAAQLVAANPYEAGNQELLIRSLLAAGDMAGAAALLEACTTLYRNELGTEPPERLAGLISRHRAAHSAAVTEVDPIAATRARLTAGRAALSAGALDAGIDALRRACRDADATRDAQLRATVLLELGGGLVHAMRCHDEAATVLHEAAALAESSGDETTAAQAYREIGFIDVQAGRRLRARNWLARAEAAAAGKPGVLASVHAIQGMELSDAARYGEAADKLGWAIDGAQVADEYQPLALATSLLGRAQLLTGDEQSARATLTQSLTAVESSQWIAFRPWPDVLLAETDLRDARLENARDRLDHAFALACELGDPCWESAAARGLGMLEYRRGHTRSALAWLQDARGRCTRPASPYQWLNAWILDALATVSSAHGTVDAPHWANELESLAARTGMREFTVRALALPGRPNGGGSRREAITAARAMAGGIDNPALDPVLGA
jgi:DNA-binding SARP family transcriptional activator